MAESPVFSRVLRWPRGAPPPVTGWHALHDLEINPPLPPTQGVLLLAGLPANRGALALMKPHSRPPGKYACRRLQLTPQIIPQCCFNVVPTRVCAQPADPSYHGNEPRSPGIPMWCTWCGMNINSTANLSLYTPMPTTSLMQFTPPILTVRDGN